MIWNVDMNFKLELKILLMLSVDESATIRVTNLSEDTRESDLQELFRPFGPIQRIYLAKDKNTGQSKVCQLICNWCIRTLKTKNSLNFFCMVCNIYSHSPYFSNALKGFAFINFHRREDAARAIAGVSGFGYDHLILNVEWAK